MSLRNVSLEFDDHRFAELDQNTRAREDGRSHERMNGLESLNKITVWGKMNLKKTDIWHAHFPQINAMQIGHWLIAFIKIPI